MIYMININYLQSFFLCYFYALMLNLATNGK